MSPTERRCTPKVFRACVLPGTLWSEEQYEAVVVWACRTRLRDFLRVALLAMGRPAGRHDAQDAFQNFCAKRLPGVLLGYAGREKLCLYRWIRLCLTRFCWREGTKLRDRLKVEVSLDSALTPGGDEAAAFLMTLFADGPAPDAGVIRAEFYRDFWPFYFRLPKPKRDLVRSVMRGTKLVDFAKRYNIPEGTVRSRWHEARKTLRRHFDREHIEEGTS